MRVKVSKLMADTIRKKCKAAGVECKVSVERYPMDAFGRSIDTDLLGNESDFEDTTNSFKVIKIVYPDNLYAMPSYLTTKGLARIYKYSDKTYDGFFREVLKAIEI